MREKGWGFGFWIWVGVWVWGFLCGGSEDDVEGLGGRGEVERLRLGGLEVAVLGVGLSDEDEDSDEEEEEEGAVGAALDGKAVVGVEGTSVTLESEDGLEVAVFVLLITGTESSFSSDSLLEVSELDSEEAADLVGEGAMSLRPLTTGSAFSLG